MRLNINESADRVRARIESTIGAPPDSVIFTGVALETPRIYGERRGEIYEVRTVYDARSAILSIGLIAISESDGRTELALTFRDGARTYAFRAVAIPLFLGFLAVLGDPDLAVIFYMAAAFSVVVGILPLLVVSIRDRRRIETAISRAFPSSMPAA